MFFKSGDSNWDIESSLLGHTVQCMYILRFVDILF